MEKTITIKGVDYPFYTTLSRLSKFLRDNGYSFISAADWWTEDMVGFVYSFLAHGMNAAAQRRDGDGYRVFTHEWYDEQFPSMVELMPQFYFAVEMITGRNVDPDAPENKKTDEVPKPIQGEPMTATTAGRLPTGSDRSAVQLPTSGGLRPGHSVTP